jgi:hypothetical protein
MANYILGSGIVGLIAKQMYPEYGIIPFKKSRYYSFEIPLADNHIVYHKAIEPFMSEVCPTDKTPIIMKSTMSYRGQLINNPPRELLEMYLKKVYIEYPDYYINLMKMVYSVYQTTVIKLYNKLQSKFQQNINEAIRNYGELVSINTKTKTLRTRSQELEYDKLISTIPLDALAKYCNINITLKSSPVCLYYIESTSTNLESNDICYVADEHIEFFKVVQLNKPNYMFWSKDTIIDPYQYFGSILGYNIEILEPQRISAMINIENPPNLKPFEDIGIYCVGSNAVHDDFLDVSSCILRLLRFKFENRINKEKIMS